MSGNQNNIPLEHNVLCSGGGYFLKSFAKSLYFFKMFYEDQAGAWARGVETAVGTVYQK